MLAVQKIDVFIFCDFGSFWYHILGDFSLILDGFEVHFCTFWCLEAAWASPGPLRGPLGRHGGPKRGSGSEKLVHCPPQAAQNEVFFCSFLVNLSFENTSKNIFVF